MEIEIVSKKENLVLGRLEVNFKVTHPKEVTPRRKEVRDEIATLLKVPKDKVVIDHMNTDFGRPETLGYAKVYKSKDEALQIETKAVLKRNKLYEEKKEEEKKEKPKKEEGKGEKKKAKKEGA